MKKELVQQLHKHFNDYAQHADGGVEFWYARDLQVLLGYDKWENFTKVIDKAKIACQNTRLVVADHFPDVRKVITAGKGAKHEIDDMALTRYACYLIAQNGDPRKEEIAFAMAYFAVQTRKQEIIEERLGRIERLHVREKLSTSEKELSGLVYERTKDEKSFAIIRSRGDKALFGGHSTQNMKEILAIQSERALADFLPTITIKAKDFANEVTSTQVKKRDLHDTRAIAGEHEKSNRDVRKILTNRDIYPERLPKAEDVKKVERRLKSEEKKLLKPASTKVKKLKRG